MIIIENNINLIIDLFKPLNPSWERLFANKTQRATTERLLKLMGYDKLVRTIAYAVKIKDEPFAPVIFTPFQLESKLAALIAHFHRNNKQLDRKGKKGWKCAYGYFHNPGEECGHGELQKYKSLEGDNLI